MAVELDVTNSDGSSSPGMFPTVQWPIRRSRAALLVPATSIVTTAEHPGFVESAIHDQLTPPVEQIEQRCLAPRSVELLLLVDRQPGHAPAFGGQSVPRVREGLLFREELPVRNLPFL